MQNTGMNRTPSPNIQMTPLSTGDPVHIAKSIGDMARAQGMTRISQKIGLDRPSLYRTFRGAVRPPFETVLNALLVLDLQLNVKLSESKRAAKPRLKAKAK